MQKQTFQQQLQEINSSTLHNMRFLLESYSNEVIEALDQQAAEQTEINDDVVFLNVSCYWVHIDTYCMCPI